MPFLIFIGGRRSERSGGYKWRRRGLERKLLPVLYQIESWAIGKPRSQGHPLQAGPAVIEL
jgi:hypothetical protein